MQQVSGVLTKSHDALLDLCSLPTHPSAPISLFPEVKPFPCLRTAFKTPLGERFVSPSLLAAAQGPPEKDGVGSALKVGRCKVKS